MDLATLDLCRAILTRIVTMDKKSSLYSSERNKLFSLMRTDIIKWVELFSLTRKIDNDPSNILSLSWDCFEYALDKYKPDSEIPFTHHFYCYTRYCLMNQFSKRQTHETKMEPYNELEHSHKIGRGAELDILLLDDYRYLKKKLPQQHQIVFEDALNSLSEVMMNRPSRISESKLGRTKYYEFKRIYKILIEFLIRGQRDDKKN
jgi:hypothetical protein